MLNIAIKAIMLSVITLTVAAPMCLCNSTTELLLKKVAEFEILDGKNQMPLI
jgi:hypothetical protein